MKIYELTPTTGQNQASFYGKAKVVIEEDGTETLYSYDTKHIKAFCGLDKAAFKKMPVEK